jgi:hypothetical protein
MKYRYLETTEEIKAFVKEFGDRYKQNAQKRGGLDMDDEESARAILTRMLQKRMEKED